LESSFDVLLLEGGLKANQLGYSPVDAQFIESVQASIPEICRWFRVSPHMVADLSRATFSNIEHLSLEFLQYTMAFWITAWEQGIRRCLLTPAEKGRFFAKFNVNSIMRSDFATRMAGYATMLQNGPFCVDDVLGLEDMNPLPNGAGQNHLVQLNMQKLQDVGKPKVVPAPAPVVAPAVPKV
jgi:HK97 family phage portal protein